MPDCARMKGVYGVLTEKQKRSARLLWEGYKVGQIASILQVHRSTIWRWYQNQDLRRYRERLVERECKKLAEKMFPETKEIINGADGKRANKVINNLLDLYLPELFP